jgi:hypothetical protein
MRKGRKEKRSLRIITFILEENGDEHCHARPLRFRDPPQGHPLGGEGVIATNMSARITVQVQVKTSVAVHLSLSYDNTKSR